MKKISIVISVGLLSLASSVVSTTMNVISKDGTVTSFDVNDVDEVSFEEEPESVVSNVVDGHTYVDLGLPSGLKWATYNIGAESIDQYGVYFAWGETAPKSNYSFSSYKHCEGDYNNMTKYCTDSDYGVVDNKSVLEAEDDAATVNWGASWRMPTNKEWNELINGCTWTWTKGYEDGNIVGRIGTSKKNGNTIFLPAAGYKENGDKIDYEYGGNYWSSSLYNSYKDHGCILVFLSGYMKCEATPRSRGLTVRAVVAK